MGSKKASGSILGRFCKGFGRISGGFGKVLGRFGPILAWILDELGRESGRALTNLKKAGAESLNRTPALLREASQSSFLQNGHQNRSKSMLKTTFSEPSLQ